MSRRFDDTVRHKVISGICLSFLTGAAITSTVFATYDTKPHEHIMYSMCEYELSTLRSYDAYHLWCENGSKHSRELAREEYLLLEKTGLDNHQIHIMTTELDILQKRINKLERELNIDKIKDN